MGEPSSSCGGQFFQGLLTGIISSGLVGAFLYALQSQNDEKKQREFTIFLYTLWKRGVGVGEIVSRVEEKLDDIRKKPPSAAKIEELEERFKRLDRELRKVFRKRPSEEYVESVATYKALADARADAAISQFEFFVLSSDGYMSVDSIREAHANLFPKNYAWSGKLRDQMVQIIGDFRAGGRNIAPSPSSYVVNVLDPREIPDKLDELVSRWNDNVQHIQRDDLKSLSQELAHFHHDFLFIHPFFDGNGRIARVVLNEQATFLTRQRMRLEFDRVKYFESLHMGDQRNIGPLRRLICDEIEKNVEHMN